MTSEISQIEIQLNGGGRTDVTRKGELVLREPKPWTGTVQALLTHLQVVGFNVAPRVAG